MTPELLAKLTAAATLPEEQINRSDPDAPFGTDWTDAVRGRFHRPATSRVGLRGGSDARFVVPVRTSILANIKVRREIQIFVDLRASRSTVRAVDLRKYLFASSNESASDTWKQ